MPAPIIAAAAIAARLAARNLANNAARKSAVKAAARAKKNLNKPTSASKSKELAKVKTLSKANKGLNMVEPYATRNAARLVDDIAKMNAKKTATKLTMRQKAGKAVVNATTGKTSAGKYAASKMRENAKPKLPSGKAKPLANPKSAVRVKPAAKQKPNKPNAAKTIFKNDSSRNRASDKAYKKVEAETKKYKVEERTGYEHQYASDAAERAGMNAKLKRKPNLNIKSK